MQNTMKKFLGSLLFLAGLLGILALLSPIFLPKTNAKEAGMRNASAVGVFAEPKDTLDVLVFGDSETYSSISPMEIWESYGISSYVCGTPSQRLNYTEQFVEQVLENQNPKLVVLETNAIFRRISFARTVKSKAETAFPIFLYHDRWKSLTAEDFSFGPTQYLYREPDRGFRFFTQTESATKKAQKKYMKPSEKKEKIPGNNAEYVAQIAQLCKDHGAEFMLLSTPSTKNWNYKRHNTIAALAESLDIEYLDMNLLQDELKINWNTDTRDRGDHLNYFGSKKATAVFGNYLYDLGILPDHRGEEAYSQWDIDLKNYHKEIEIALATEGMDGTAGGEVKQNP